MFVIDFKLSRKQAFSHGFLKGLAAPVMLYHAEAAPDLPAANYVVLPSVSPAQAIAGDWMRIGSDMQNVIKKHADAKAA